MQFSQLSRASRFGALFGLVALASCQTGGVKQTLDVGKPGDEQLTADDLRAYCPRVTLLEGTAILKTYTKGHKDDPEQIVYQATITDVTRTCNYQAGTLYMEVVAAGRVVYGPKGAPGNLQLPIRVVVKQGDGVQYSQLGKIQVAVSPDGEANQFIFKDTQVAVPAPTAQNLQVITGFDEGPYNTP